MNNQSDNLDLDPNNTTIVTVLEPQSQTMDEQDQELANLRDDGSDTMSTDCHPSSSLTKFGGKVKRGEGSRKPEWWKGFMGNLQMEVEKSTRSVALNVNHM